MATTKQDGAAVDAFGNLTGAQRAALASIQQRAGSLDSATAAALLRSGLVRSTGRFCSYKATAAAGRAVEAAASHDLAVLEQYARSNLGRFALALAAGNTPEDAATMARARATADRVEFAIEAALDRSGR